MLTNESFSGNDQMRINGWTFNEYWQLLQDQFIRRTIDRDTAADYWMLGVGVLEAADLISGGFGIV